MGAPDAGVQIAWQDSSRPPKETVTCFLISGAMAYLAAWYFRRASRHPDPGGHLHALFCEGIYHVGSHGSDDRHLFVNDEDRNDFLNVAATRLGFAPITFDTLESRVKLPKNAWRHSGDQ